MSSLRFKLTGLALVAALGASAAQAQTFPSLFGKQRNAPAVKVEQQGQNNGAAVGQNGPRNSAGIGQKGDNNVGQISQNGANNAAGVYQIGRNNEGGITQTGNNNEACLIQAGRNQSATITQSGNQSVGVLQTTKGAREISARNCEARAEKTRIVYSIFKRLH